MIQINPCLLKDFYKVGHKFQYPKNTGLVYSNLTPRGSRVEGVDGVIAFGFQYFVKEYLQTQFAAWFFAQDRDYVVKSYKRRVDNALGPGTDVSHIGELHELGYLPLHVKAVPEGTLVPFRVPLLTIRNTEPEFYWLTNMVETMLSNALWLPITSATTAFGYRKVFEKYAWLTGADPNFVQWQGHDFSYRGLCGTEAACLSGAAHLLSFTGTDTIPAIDFLENYYGANSDLELVGGSVPATEHAVMCMGASADKSKSLSDGEFETIKRLITETYPTGIISIVCDTWDFWKVLTDYLPRLKEAILARNGKVVIRPDSGDPVKIICGDKDSPIEHVYDGALNVLWQIFGGTANEAGYDVLDPHIGLIYGDSITPSRQVEILSDMLKQGLASSNVVLGIGSYTYQYVTRDTFGLAVKATYGEIEVPNLENPKETRIVGQAIFKDPATDDGLKKSAKGLLKVDYVDNKLVVVEECSWTEEAQGILQTIFLDSHVYAEQTLAQIRARVKANL